MTIRGVRIISTPFRQTSLIRPTDFFRTPLAPRLAIPERRSLIRDRNELKRLLFDIPARASLGQDGGGRWRAARNPV